MLSYLFPSCFSDDFWLWNWVAGIAETSIWYGSYCKNQLSQKLDFSWVQGKFFMILGGLGTNFHEFCCPGVWLENWWIFKPFWDHPRSWDRVWLVVTWPVPGPSVTLFQDPRNLIIEILRPELGILRLRTGYIGYRVHWKRDYTRIPRSLVAPSRGAGGFDYPWVCSKYWVVGGLLEFRHLRIDHHRWLYHE